MNNFEHLMQDMTLNKLSTLWTSDMCSYARFYHGKCESPCSLCVKMYLAGEYQEPDTLDKLLDDIRDFLDAPVHIACCAYKHSEDNKNLNCDECDWFDGSMTCNEHVIQDIYNRLLNLKGGA